MKKLMLALLLIVLLSSCESGFKEQMVTEKSDVPLSYMDSTKWRKAKIYYYDSRIMYVKTGQYVYQVESNSPVAFWVGLILGCIVIGVAMGIKISEKSSN